MKELKQKSLGRYRFYQIAEDRLVIKTKNIDTYEEYFIKFNELGLDLTRKQIKGVLFFKIVFILFTILGVYVFIDDFLKGVKLSQLFGSIFIMLFFAGFSVYSILIKVDKVFIQGGTRVLELEGSNPDRQTVDTFITNLQGAVRNYYKNKYALIDPTLNEEMQIHNYKWLKEMNAITDIEYDELINNLKIKNLLN